MIDLYFAPTPNGFKISIMLEELGVPYNAFPVNIMTGDQYAPDFLAISPNNKIPAIVDHQGPGGQKIELMESGAILLYLAEKYRRFIPADVNERFNVLQWLMWQMGGFGPMLGQAHHFLRYAPEEIEYAQNRYANEAKRLYGVLEKQLEGKDWVCGDYSIADMAIFPWTKSYETQRIDMETHPNIKAWRDRMQARPAVERGQALLPDVFDSQKAKATSQEILFGNKPA